MYTPPTQPHYTLPIFGMDAVVFARYMVACLVHLLSDLMLEHEHAYDGAVETLRLDIQGWREVGLGWAWVGLGLGLGFVASWLFARKSPCEKCVPRGAFDVTEPIRCCRWSAATSSA